MENEPAKNETAEKVIKLAILPINGKNPLFLMSSVGSIGMFIIDHNGFLSIPWPIVWLPLAFCFAPILLVILAAAIVAVVWSSVVIALSVGYCLLMLWSGVKMTYLKAKRAIKNSLKRKSPAQ